MDGRIFKQQIGPIKVSIAALVILVSILAFGLTVRAQVQAPDPDKLNWLVAGPFPGDEANSLFKDHLSAPGEAAVRATPGSTAGRNAGTNIVWQPAEISDGGAIDLSRLVPDGKRSVVFAYSEISSPTAQNIVALLGSGVNIQLRLNGEILFENKLSRKPESGRDTIVLPLRKGINRILIKTQGRGSDWQLHWKLHRPDGPVFINERNTIVPDLRVGEKTSAWGQVEIANVSSREIKDAVLEVTGSDLFYPGESATFSLLPGEVNFVPVWVAARRPARESDSSPIRFQIQASGTAVNTEYKPLVRKADSYFVTTYRSSVDGSIQPYSVFLPSNYDPNRNYPLALLLHGAHVTGWGQNIISYDQKDWAIQIAVHDRGNNRYRDIGEVDIDEVLADAKRRFSIDPERIYLAGHSMGGYGTWWQATRRPDMWASISPQAGYSDYFLYDRPLANASREEFQRRILESWSPYYFAENLLHLRAYIVHGAKDDNVSVEHSRKMDERLKELGYESEYDENPEGGHWWGPKGKTYGTEIVDKPAIWTFLRETDRRMSSPKKVIYKTDSLHYRKAYWVEIDELQTANRTARIEAEVTGPNAIDVKAENIEQFTLVPGSRLIDLARPLQVRVNGRPAFVGELPTSGRLTIRAGGVGKFIQVFGSEDLHIPGTNGFAATAAELDETGKLRRFITLRNEAVQKNPEIYGPVSDAFNSPFLFVVGTGASGGAALNKSAADAAMKLAREWMMRTGGIVHIKRDIDVTAHDIETENLVLFGNERSNSLTARINAQLPVRLEGRSVNVAGTRYSGADTGLIMIAPNPLRLRRYVVVVGGTTPNSFETAARLNFLELPDFVVFDRRTLSGPTVQYAAGGFFDKFWRVDKAANTRTTAQAGQ